MKNSKKQLENAILTIAKHLNLEESYNALFTSFPGGFPKITQMIAYDMFLNKFDSRSCSDELYNAWHIILDYGLELKSKGFVEFETK